MKNKKLTQNKKQFRELLDEIMQSASYELDSYIDNDAFNTGTLEIDDNKLSVFFQSLLPEIVLEDGDQYFLKLLKENTNENCKKFFAWLYEFAQTINSAFQKTAGIRNLEIDEFGQLFDFCLEKLILHNVGIEEAENDGQGQELFNKDNLKLMAGLINTYFIQIFKGNSKYSISRSMHRSLGFSEDRCQFFWEKYLQNEDVLWRKYSIKLQNEINDNINILIDTFREIEEE